MEIISLKIKVLDDIFRDNGFDLPAINKINSKVIKQRVDKRTDDIFDILGTYDAKEEGFGPGCSSLHSMMIPHGPESAVFEKMS